MSVCLFPSLMWSSAYRYGCRCSRCVVGRNADQRRRDREGPARRRAGLWDYGALAQVVFRGDWVDEAACRDSGLPTSAWFPARDERWDPVVLQAREICAGCPVAAECLEYALESDERIGVWGGLSGKQRRALRSQKAAS